MLSAHRTATAVLLPFLRNPPPDKLCTVLISCADLLATWCGACAVGLLTAMGLYGIKNR
jgi:hypothetical protein